MVTLDQIKACPATPTRNRGTHAADSVTILLPTRRAKKASRQTEQLWFKPESLQPIGSFKLRGAYNKIASFSEDRATARRDLVLQRQPCPGRRLRSAGAWA